MINARQTLAVTLVAMTTAVASADIFTVPGNFATIQAAIDSPVTGDGDELVLTAPLYVGAGNVNIDFRGQRLTLRSETGNAEDCTISGQDAARVMIFQSGEGPGARVEGIRIAAGRASTGGGILITGGSDPTIEGCIIEACRALLDGGGVSCIASAPRLDACTFIGNSADGIGGGVSVLVGEPTITGSTFIENTATDGLLSAGGAVAAANSTLVIRQCIFLANEATASGGAVNEVDGSSTIDRCFFAGNQAEDGGAFFTRAGESTNVIGSVFSGNRAGREGGAVYVAVGSGPSLTNCTASGNEGPVGGGAVFVAQGASVGIANSILWGNAPDPVAGGGEIAVSFTDFDDADGGRGNLAVDPLFASAAGADGIVGTGDDDLRVLPGSPVIDAGDNMAVPIDAVTDIDGASRFADDQGTADTGAGDAPIVDMGAYEFGGTSGRPCPADLDGSGDVGFPDLLQVLGSWDEGKGPADIDGDGMVGFSDLLLVLGTWGECG